MRRTISRQTRHNLKLVLFVYAAMEISRSRRSAWREAERQTNSQFLSRDFIRGRGVGQWKAKDSILESENEKRRIFPKNLQNVLMGVAINDKHRVHARKKESFSRVLRKKKRFGDRMVGNVLGSFPARCMIKERQRMLRNRLFLATKINDETT